jgi:hypothetical protein
LQRRTAVDEMIQRLRDAERDRDRWKAKAEELAVWEPRLLSFDGAEVRIAVAKHVSSLIADSMLAILDSVDAPNYVEMTFNRRNGEAMQEYRATFHRPGCKTPHQVKDEALAALSAAEARVKELEGERDRLELCRDAAIDVSLAAFNLLADMKAYEAWERPCHAVSRLEGALGCWQSAAAAAARAEKEGDRNG